jgi:hypothetical protein
MQEKYERERGAHMQGKCEREGRPAVRDDACKYYSD